MSDLKVAHERLPEDGSGLGPAPGAGVRRNADRRRRAGWAAVPLAAALLATAVLVPFALLSGSEDGGRPPVSVVPAQSGPSPDQPWLPRPWQVDSVQRISLSAVGDDFCDVARSRGELTAVRQNLSDGARVVRVYAIATQSFERAADLFKEVYARCAARAPVSSEAGPAMYWQAVSGAASAALWDNTTVYLGRVS